MSCRFKAQKCGPATAASLRSVVKNGNRVPATVVVRMLSHTSLLSIVIINTDRMRCGFMDVFINNGLKAVMIAHFSADTVVHVITPTIASLIIG